MVSPPLLPPFPISSIIRSSVKTVRGDSFHLLHFSSFYLYCFPVFSQSSYIWLPLLV